MTAALLVAGWLTWAAALMVWRRRVRRATDHAARLACMADHPAGKWAGRRVLEARRGFVVAALEGETFECPFCGGDVAVLGDPAAWQVDHATARHHGGGHTPGNLRPAHTACNARAGQRLSSRKAVRPW